LVSTGERPKAPTIFRFENYWLHRPDLKELVVKTWNKNRNGRNNMDKWHNMVVALRKILKGWNNNIEGVYKKTEKTLSKILTG
jgi:hypothetical protein